MVGQTRTTVLLLMATLAMVVHPAVGAPPAEVVGRHIFYNESAFDDGQAMANWADDGAIAPDKTALLPGQTATFANYTSYSKGINGVMVDILNTPGVPTAADFALRMGNNEDPASWVAAPAPVVTTVRSGAGTTQSDRVTLIWPDRAILGQWLEVCVLPTATTGLAGSDVFYYGNAPGDTGDARDHAVVNATDMVLTRDNSHSFLDPAPIDCPHDHDRDRRVYASEMWVVRDNATSPLTALRLVTSPVLSAASASPFPSIDVGDHVLQADTPGQTITIRVSGSQPVSGLNLLVQIGDGGPALGGTAGPQITDVNVATGILGDGLPYLEAAPLKLPHAAASYIAITMSGVSVPADGVLAELTLDTTGFAVGTWDLKLAGVLTGYPGPHNTDFAGIPADIHNGSITIVPEPATLSLLALAVLPLPRRRGKSPRSR